MRTRTPRARMRAGARTVCRLSFNARKKRSASVTLPASTLTARWAATVVRHSTACAHSSAATSAGDARRAGVRGLSCGSGAGDVGGDGDDVNGVGGSITGDGGERRVVGDIFLLDSGDHGVDRSGNRHQDRVRLHLNAHAHPDERDG